MSNKDFVSQLLNIAEELEGDDSGKRKPVPADHTTMLEKLSHKAQSEFVSYDKLPHQVKKDIIDLAKYLYSVNRNKTVLTGGPLTGKTFCVEQFAYHAETILHDAQMVPDDIPVAVFHADVRKYAQGKEREFLEAVANTVNHYEGEIIIYADNYLTAGLVESSFPSLHIIFETQPEMLNSLKSHGVELSDWNFVHGLFNSYTRRDVTDALSKYHKRVLEDYYNFSVPRNFISNFVSHVYENSTALSLAEKGAESEEEEIMNAVLATNGQEPHYIPIGYWVAMLSDMIGEIKFRPQEYFRRNGEISQSRIFDYAIKENEQLLNPHKHNMSDVLNTLMGGGMGQGEEGGSKSITILSGSSLGLAPEKEEEQVAEPLVYSDMRTFSDRLKEQVIGQDEVVDKVANGFMISAAGLQDKSKPIRSMLFLGPTGVGKTKLAQTISEELGKDEMNMIRLDMSEYSSEHESAKLFGAPPGYLGHENGGVLTEQVKENPQSVILLDEVEKAHPRIFDSFLQVLDAGHMTDSHGDVVDFKETVIIMTSNLGTNSAMESSIGYGATLGKSSMTPEKKYQIMKKNAEKEVAGYFKPEMINRIDDLIVFNHLQGGVLKSIADLQIEELMQRVKDSSGGKDELVPPTDDVVFKIIENADAAKFGARDIARNIARNLTHLIAEALIRTDITSRRKITLHLDENEEIGVDIEKRVVTPNDVQQKDGSSTGGRRRVSSRGSGRISPRAGG